jgi:hypothetical protein
VDAEHIIPSEPVERADRNRYGMHIADPDESCGSSGRELVGREIASPARHERRRHGKPDSLGGLEIDDPDPVATT